MENQQITYKTLDGEVVIDVNLKGDTVWLSQKQMAELFDKDTDTIGLHLRNIYKSKELERIATTEKYSVVQQEGSRKVRRKVSFYNLDAIISVGYRVNSIKGTQFRIWASKILKAHLIEGYTLNQKRLNETKEKYHLLLNTINIAASTANTKTLSSSEASGILHVLKQYAYALETLDKYDHQELSVGSSDRKEVWKLSYEDAINQIRIWKDAQQATDLFGNEKDQSFKSSLESIYQTFGGDELYPSIEEKAAHLLYFIVKNHSFSDGNKRIAAGLFAYFLDRNEVLFKVDGSKRVEDNALVAITIMIAESKSEEKEMMTTLVVNLINDRN